MSLSNYTENAVLNAMRGGTPFSVSAIYAKLHLGDPGENGTDNAALETTREVVTFDAPVNGVMALAVNTTWSSVAATETYAGVSLWDSAGPTGGNCLGAGTLTASGQSAAGSDFLIQAGDLTVSLA